MAIAPRTLAGGEREGLRHREVLPTGTWENVTPKNVDLTNRLSCDNFGVGTVQADRANPGHVYAFFDCQGLWRSTDHGATWTGPVSPGSVRDCAGGITIGGNGAMYLTCIRGAAFGFWRSTDGGRSWKSHRVGPLSADRQDVYPPVVDPYDPEHLVMAGHEQDAVVESTNGGRTWTRVPLDPRMLTGGGTASINFINTGVASSTRSTLLWLAQQSDRFGAWRTVNGGGAWVQVDKNEHPHGGAQIFQPDASGVVYMAGAYSIHGWGVLRSADFGVTWKHVGASGNQREVFGTAKTVFSAYSYPTGLGSTNGPSLQRAAQPGTGSWSAMDTPAEMKQGAAQAVTTTDGTTHYVITANYGAGLWRYVER